LRPELKTMPRVYYKNLYRYEKCFVGGNIVLRDSDECAEGAEIRLTHKAPKEVRTAVTNNYGDFKIDDLEGDSGVYTVLIEYPAYRKMSIDIDLKTSLNMGTIFLEPTNGQGL